jgi:preprotein translocase subunit SecE
MATQTRGSAAGKTAARSARQAKPERVTPGRFVRQVIDELRKVVWPTRKELVTYTIVSLVFILVMVAIVSLLDVGFYRLVLAIFG